MTDPQVILDDIIRGKSFLTNLVHNEIFADQVGVSKGNCDVDANCLLYILKALEYRTEQDLYDKITEKLYRDLILIIGKYIAPILSLFYYGVKSTPDPITQSQILASSFVLGLSGSNPIIPFPFTETPQYPWMAEVSNQPLKTKWQDTVIEFNNGLIGTSDDLFGVPVTSGIFRLYDVEYATQFQYPIQFKVS